MPRPAIPSDTTIPSLVAQGTSGTSPWRAHALLLLEGLCVLLRPSEAWARAQPAGRRFPLARGALAGVLVPMVVLSLVVDLPLAGFFLHLRAPVAWRLPLHLAVAITGLWSLAWAIGLRSATQRIAHVLTDDALVLAIAFRAPARVARACIADAEAIKGDLRAWREAHGVGRLDVERQAAVDAPTLVIERDVPDHAGRRWIAVQVDDAVGLRAALRARAAAPAPHS